MTRSRSDWSSGNDSQSRAEDARWREGAVRQAVRVLGADRVRKIVDETQSNDYLQPGEMVT